MKMTIKDKSESIPKTKNKILVLGLILITIVGLLSPMQASAQAPTNSDYQLCINRGGSPTECARAYPDRVTPPAAATAPWYYEYKGGFLNQNTIAGPFATQAECQSQTSPGALVRLCFQSNTPPAPLTPEQEAATPPPATGGGLPDNVPSCWNLTRFDVGKCLISISYFIFYTIPSSLLALSAIFFNAILALTLSSSMYSASFIADAWAIVRDLSNLFFILILLYIAVRTILGLGGSDVKKMIAQVIIMALLINFSMFFTKIVIDSSNILALIFYNRINVETMEKIDDKYVVRFYKYFINPNKSGVVEKDISGGIFNSFDPSKLMTPAFFEKAKKPTVGLDASWLGFGAYVGVGAAVGGPIGGLVGAGAYGVKTVFTGVFDEEVPDGLILTIILVSGLVMAFAAYAFFIIGLTFLSRLAELWILIIFSPFAFMSSTVPILSGVEGIGWDEWLKRVLKLSFLAPIFMFFLYLIFLLVQTPFLKDYVNLDLDTYQTMLLIILQSTVVLIILNKITEKAKKASGELGDMVIKGAGVATGIVSGLAIGGIAAGLQGTVGQASSMLANSEWAKRREAEGRFGGAALRRVAQFGATTSFDARKGVVGAAIGAASSVTGLDFGAKSQLLLRKDGGFEADKKRKIEERQKRVKELEVGEDEGLKQNVRTAEAALDAEKSNPVTQNEIVRQTAAMGAAERALATSDREVAAAERTLKDATDQLAQVTAQFGAISVQANAARTNVADARTDRDTIINRRDGAGGTREALENIQAALRAAKGPISRAEDALKIAQNAVVAENRTRRINYADVTENNLLSRIDFLNAGMGNAQREAANKIRAGIQEEKK